ncbi:MAG: c-type cytochrome [Acidobacteriota bacterium]
MKQSPASRFSVRRFARVPLLAGTAVILAAGILSSAPASAAESTQFKNLKIFPQDIQKKKLVNTMKAFAGSLGVRCSHCHVGEGDDLSTYDFPSDEKREKRVARRMIRMVRGINKNTISKLPPDPDHVSDEPVRVRCVTCHRRKPIPEIEAKP